MEGGLRGKTNLEFRLHHANVLNLDIKFIGLCDFISMSACICLMKAAVKVFLCKMWYQLLYCTKLLFVLWFFNLQGQMHYTYG